MCPRLLTSSFGFWNSGVAKNGEGVRTDGIRGSSSLILNVSGLANRTLRDAGLVGVAGVFLFRALDRLEVGVGEGVEELLVGVAGVLVTSGPDPSSGPVPGRRLSAIVSAVDDVGDVVPWCWGLPWPCRWGPVVLQAAR